MGWLDKLIERRVGEVLDAKMPDLMARVMKGRAMKKIAPPPGYQLTQIGFAWEIAFEFIRNGCEVWTARDMAYDALRAFLKDEKIKFGDPAYAWDQEGAADIAREEMQHWEVAA